MSGTNFDSCIALNSRTRWWLVPGVLLLSAYVFVTLGLLPDVTSAKFGRAFAVYGGIFGSHVTVVERSGGWLCP